ncbi:hypothetical protein DICSQDRAFT_70403, partial [Dichomitus squalens LYAD-421 SS1]
FDGDRDNLRTFLNELFLFFEARPADYATDQSRIVTALTFMDGPKVIAWKDGYIAQARRNGWNTWNAFEMVLQQTFQPIEEAATAASKLYHLDYRPAAPDAFNAEFFRLCALAGILKDSAQLSFYKERLPESMRRRVRLTYPIPTTVNEWAARVLEIEHSNYEERHLRQLEGRSRNDRQGQGTKGQSARTNSIRRVDAPAMKEDREKKQCFYCHKTGHIARDCLKKKADNRAKGRQPGQKKRKVRKVDELEDGEVADDEDNGEATPDKTISQVDIGDSDEGF